jgi:hypothetical protein
MEPKRFSDITSEEKVRSQPIKIGGVLILVAIGLIISFLQNLGFLGQCLAPFRGGAWERLTTPGFRAYDPYWRPAILSGIITESVIVAVSLILLVLFFRKHRFFPTLIVVAIPVTFVLVLVNYYFEGLVPAIAASAAYAEQRQMLLIKFVAMHVWIPYFVVSERVKQTFVR